MSHTITVPCPHVMDDGAPCEADVVVHVVFEPGEKATRDYPGTPEYWAVQGVADRCAAGHALEDQEWQEAYDVAEQYAADYRPEVPSRYDEI